MPRDASPDPNSKYAPYRSWGEMQIARALTWHSIPFTYEQPLAIVEGLHTRIWYPDFALRGLGVYLEYCGLTDDPAYSRSMETKREVYDANGLTVLMFTPKLFRGNWPARLRDDINETLENRLSSFNEKRPNRANRRS